MSNQGRHVTGEFFIEFWAFHSDSVNRAVTIVPYLGKERIKVMPANSTREGTFTVYLNSLPATKPITGNPPNSPIIPGHKYYIGWRLDTASLYKTWPPPDYYYSVGWECDEDNKGVSGWPKHFSCVKF